MPNFSRPIIPYAYVRPPLSIPNLSGNSESSSAQIDKNVLSSIDEWKNALSKNCFDYNLHFKIKNSDKSYNLWKLDNVEPENYMESLLELLNKAEGDDDYKYTLDNWIETKGCMELYINVKQLISADISSNKLGYNAKKLLADKDILNYLFCRAYDFNNLSEASSIYYYISNSVDANGGVKLFYDSIVIKVSEKIKDEKKLKIDDSKVNAKINEILKNKNLSFEASIFSSEVYKIIVDQAFGGYNNYEIIKGLNKNYKLNIGEEDIPALVEYIKKSNIPITKENAIYYIPDIYNDIKNPNLSYLQVSETGKIDSDFSVDLFEDDYGILDFDPKSIECAAQLWYSMVYLDEAEISNAVDTIITKYLLTGKINIKSRESIRDIQLYALNRKFREVNTGMEYERTQPEERRMYYMQVFNAGGDEGVEGMAYNPDFPILWGNLLTATAKFIEQAALNDYPGQNLSRNKIIQAVEAVGSNISTHCSGMVKAASPYISGELSFGVRKILLNEEIREQIAPGNKGFSKVLTNVLKDLRGEAPNIHALGNRARYGYEIISNIAKYTPGYLDDDKNFNKMVNAIEGFIIANSQLENMGIPRLENIEGEEKVATVGESRDWNF